MPHIDQSAVTVITPTGLHPTRLPFFEELYDSHRAQEDVTREWITVPYRPQADPALIPPRITKDRRVRVVARLCHSMHAPEQEIIGAAFMAPGFFRAMPQFSCRNRGATVPGREVGARCQLRAAGTGTRRVSNSGKPRSV